MKIARAASLIALGNIASRAFGLGREILKSHLFGSGAAVDAFNVATRVPLLLYDLLIGGMIHSSLVPVFSSYEKDRQADLWALFITLFNLTAILVAALVILIELFAPQVARFMSGGSPDDVLALTAELMRITTPALLFLSLGGILSGLLYALRQFAWVALTLTIFNAAIVLGTVLLHQQLGIHAMAYSVLFGGILSLVIQIPGLRGIRSSYALRLNHPDLQRVIRLYIPIILGLLVEILISKPVTYNLASQTGVGGIAWMDYATTLWQFPQGLVAVAVSFAILPSLSAAASAGIETDFHTTLIRGLKLIIALIIPAAVAMFILAPQIVALIFQHGSFTQADTLRTSEVLRLYLLGLPFNAVDLLLVFAFYARQHTLTPALIGSITSIGYVILATILVRSIGLLGIMSADVIRIGLHVVICGWMLRQFMGGFGETLIRVLAASALMGGVIYATSGFWDHQSGLLFEIMRLAVPSLLGGVIYAVVMFGWLRKAL